MLLKKTNILITGCCGFVGFHLTEFILKNTKIKIYGLDNLNNYYDVKLKVDRLKILKKYKNFNFIKLDIINKKKLLNYFKNKNIKIILHLAAQAGVRYSLLRPDSYINSNIIGSFNILELSKKIKVKHLILASTSSVYGLSKEMPFTENASSNHPIQLYAATKKSMEIMAHSYSYLFNIPTTCIRFFTVYGPYGRPDMALFKFVNSILKNKKIDIYNHGKHSRDFTYVLDLVENIYSLITKPPRTNQNWNAFKPDQSCSKAPYRVINFATGKKIKLMEYIKTIEKEIGKKFKKNFLNLQKGDIEDTHANISKIKKLTGIKRRTKLKYGINKFVNWFRDYYNL